MANRNNAGNAADDILSLVNEMDAKKEVSKSMEITQETIDALYDSIRNLRIAKQTIDDAILKENCYIHKYNEYCNKYKSIYKDLDGILERAKSIKVSAELTETDRAFFKKTYNDYAADLDSVRKKHIEDLNTILTKHLSATRNMLDEERRSFRNLTDGVYFSGVTVIWWWVTLILAVGIIVAQLVVWLHPMFTE